MAKVVIGKMDTRIKFVTHVTVIGDAGGLKTVPDGEFTMWAAVRNLSSTQLLLEGKQQLQNAYRIVCRYVPDADKQVKNNQVIEWNRSGNIIRLVIVSAKLKDPDGTAGRYRFWEIIANGNTDAQRG